MHGYNTVHKVKKSQRINYVYRCDVSVDPKLACVLYKQAKTLGDFVLGLFLKMCLNSIPYCHSFHQSI